MLTKIPAAMKIGVEDILTGIVVSLMVRCYHDWGYDIIMVSSLGIIYVLWDYH